MTRENKFRAWDEVNKKMVEVTGISWFSDGVRISHIVYEDKEPLTCPECGKPESKTTCIFNNFVLEEYTGKKDKNGEEIYEGDLVKWYVNDREPEGEIVFQDGGFWIDKVWNDWLRGEYEIIGNIHEGEEKT